MNINLNIHVYIHIYAYIIHSHQMKTKMAQHRAIMTLDFIPVMQT